jgi:hypothetical protein
MIMYIYYIKQPQNLDRKNSRIQSSSSEKLVAKHLCGDYYTPNWFHVQLAQHLTPPPST